MLDMMRLTQSCLEASPLAVKARQHHLVLESLRVKTGSKPITHVRRKKAKAKATRLPNNPSLSPAFVSNSHLFAIAARGVRNNPNLRIIGSDSSWLPLLVSPCHPVCMEDSKLPATD